MEPIRFTAVDVDNGQGSVLAMQIFLKFSRQDHEFVVLRDGHLSKPFIASKLVPIPNGYDFFISIRGGWTDSASLTFSAGSALATNEILDWGVIGDGSTDAQTDWGVIGDGSPDTQTDWGNI
jgi:hypothetical protein